MSPDDRTYVHYTEAENEAGQSWHHPINHHRLYNYDGIKPGSLNT